MVDLLKDKSFESITIRDISQAAMINRGTFYTYYRDKYEVIASYQSQMIKDIDRLLYENISGESLNLLNDQQLQETIEGFFNYLKDNRERVMVIAAGLGTSALSEYFSHHMFDFYKVKSQEFGVEFESEVDEEYLITYMIHAHMGLLFKWLTDGCVVPVSKMADFIETFTVKGVFKAVGI
ncbi:TetR/AcrR family transcriptional regulator C-terminal domain-containing protein [Jeotgalicoccus sp. ATCC 8456]|nr:TetR/AcrR family transcriptional regulator C-terminal domain-containing protein [Jeotgalicoccus marinus]QQD86111.1 TetR/AcrR family transcriptional regulator C-terminal domain-containing protein [Jeotgalicoccus sp. ATCC 8456]